jgi:subtilisin family serine protease
VRNLAVSANDPTFAAQLTLHMTDMDSAWRFTNGSNQVLLASLDTGVLTAAGAQGGIHDLDLSRLITDPTDDDNRAGSGHGHSAISVMASISDNGDKVAGINWNSSVFVNDVYSGVSLQKAITDTIAYARANNLKVVFQGGIQGEFWLTSGGTRAQLENLISASRDIAVFAIAAGNGGPGGNLTDPNYLTSVSGVAKLQTNHTNVMSVGALSATGSTVVGGLTNAVSVDLASYSNRGANLTMVAPTNNHAADKLGNVRIFGGTSAANPFMAGVASLVWSVNPNLNGAEVRDVLRRSAMDLGAVGTDNTFGAGLVNADAAVRRAMALGVDKRLATLNDFRIDAPLQPVVALGLPITPIAARPPSMESSVWSLRTTQDRGDVLAMTAVYEKSPFLG